MRTVFFLLITGCLCSPKLASASSICDVGWASYKDEYCFRAFADFLSYDDATYFCASQSNRLSISTLVMVKDAEMQEFLANYTEDIYEHLWLGGKYDTISNNFQWNDGEKLTFSNWAEGYPRNHTDSEYCIQLKPKNAMQADSINGKWEDAVCHKRNLAICQRTAVWNPADTTREIIKLRRELKTTQQQLDSTSSHLHEVSSRVVPIGSIYVEYFNQPSPVELWPFLEWKDITSLYEGLFFRALGGSSEAWGVSQNDCSSRISEMVYEELEGPPTVVVNPLTFPGSGWSRYGQAGTSYRPASTYWERVKFFVDACETRPKNQAIKIWKRLG